MFSPASSCSPSDKTAEGSLADTSSVTLPVLGTKGWETSSTSEEETSSQTSKRTRSTCDELIGSPQLSVISLDSSNSAEAEFDQETVISFNDNDSTMEDLISAVCYGLHLMLLVLSTLYLFLLLNSIRYDIKCSY